MQAGSGRGGRERRDEPTPGGVRGKLPHPRVNVPPTIPSNPTPQPPIPRRTRGVPRSLFYLSLLSIVLPLDGAVLGPAAAVQPVASTQHSGLTNAVQPAYTLPPAIVTTEFQPTVTEGRVQLALEDHRAGVPLSPEELSQHEGGCGVDQLDGMAHNGKCTQICEPIFQGRRKSISKNDSQHGGKRTSRKTI